jgi:hypothetical protein
MGEGDAMPLMTFTSGLTFEVPPAMSIADSPMWSKGDRPTAAAADRFAGLRRCEDFFFSFNFSQLIQLSSVLIDQKTEFGDAYAFRCFATLGEIQLGAAEDAGHDLVDLLRDYFGACERPLLTEGATVCRLFLKLVFGDLVKRISRAQRGSRFALEKSDPLCGGAFAVLDGDFGSARKRFDAAISDPGSRAYALAGIGLLKMFDSDVSGALMAFNHAGPGDEDIQALSGWLRH